ncbi:MAG: ABC transporter permease [Planctomycetes bacterium]|nr:ABC transporter permease [Planctomycetota bacterium]
MTSTSGRSGGSLLGAPAAMLRSVGRFTASHSQSAGYAVGLLLRAATSIHYLPRRLRFTLDAAYAAGVRALPVALTVAFFAGMILALQTGLELRRYGQSDAIGSIVSLSMCREMGPLMTGIILAATVGSAIAAELGTMTVSEEVTALDVMSIDAVNYLALPRIVGLTIICPIVTVFADLVGVAGGAAIAGTSLGITQTTYWSAVRASLAPADEWLPEDIYVGLFKAVVFGCTIATVSCSAGLRATGGALGVGRAVQHAVMTSVVLIIVFGYAITWLYYFLLRG